LWVHVPQFNRRSLMLKERSGLGVAASPNGLTVAHVASGSPAAAGGWTTGERIVAINGQRVDASYTRGSLWRWRFQPAGHVVSLTLADGHERKITLDDYY
jgi:S1-C subfamily serine protease